MQATIAAPGETGPNLQARLGARARAAALIPIVMDLPGLAGAARALTADLGLARTRYRQIAPIRA